MFYVVASTGGIGSGKSYVSNLFQAMGVPIYNSDIRAKELYLEDHTLSSKLSTLIGQPIIVDGVLQRKVLSDKLFSNSSLLLQANQLVHPVVLKDFKKWCKAQREKGHKAVIIESAIILNLPSFMSLIDKVLVVHTPLEVRRERVMLRDGISAEEFDRRAENQPNDAFFLERADFIVDSWGEKAVVPQVISILKELNIS